MEFNLPKGYLSASSIGTYLRCGMQYKFRYIDGIISPPNIAMTQGSAAHTTFENYFNVVLAGGNRMTPQEARDAGVHYLEQQLQENELTLPDTDLTHHKKEMEIITQSYVANVAKDITPISVEEEITYQTKGGVEILAYIDLIHGDEVIADYKITKKKWNLAQLQNSLQFKIYALSTGLMEIEVHNIVKTIKTPKVFNKIAEDGTREVGSNLRILSNTFAPENDFLETQIEAVAGAITQGVFIPTDPSNWVCNPNWCGYWDRCRKN